MKSLQRIYDRIKSGIRLQFRLRMLICIIAVVAIAASLWHPVIRPWLESRKQEKAIARAYANVNDGQTGSSGFDLNNPCMDEVRSRSRYTLRQGEILQGDDCTIHWVDLPSFSTHRKYSKELHCSQCGALLPGTSIEQVE